MSIRFFSKSSIRTGEKYSNAWDKTLSRDYELISTTLISSNTASVTFDSIPSDYKHLQIRMVTRRSDSGNNNVRLRFNSDSGSNYRNHFLYGDGSSVTSGTSTSTYTLASRSTASNDTANAFGTGICDILDYNSTSKNTTIRSLAGNPGGTGNFVWLYSGLWLNTNAVTSITLLEADSNFVSGSRFSLYGIKG